MIYSQPLLDLDEEKTALAAEESIFMNADAMKKLMNIVLTDKSALNEPKTKKIMALL